MNIGMCVEFINIFLFLSGTSGDTITSGVTKTKKLNGNLSLQYSLSENENPNLVMLNGKEDKNRLIKFVVRIGEDGCSGVLVTRLWVLTYGGCALDAKQVIVESRNGTEQRVGVERTILPANFQPSGIGNKFGLIRLQRPLLRGVSMATLATSPWKNNLHQTCMTAGYGKIYKGEDIAMTYKLHYINGYFGRSREICGCRRVYKFGTAICYKVENATGPCHDLGALIVCEGTVVGLLAFNGPSQCPDAPNHFPPDEQNKRCGLVGITNYYCDVGRYYSWIKKNTVKPCNRDMIGDNVDDENDNNGQYKIKASIFIHLFLYLLLLLYISK